MGRDGVGWEKDSCGLQAAAGWNCPAQSCCGAAPAPPRQCGGWVGCAEAEGWEQEAAVAVSRVCPRTAQLPPAAGLRGATGGCSHAHLALVKVVDDLVVESLLQLALGVQTGAVQALHGGCGRLVRPLRRGSGSPSR